jgi:cytoskeletal protein RodZ
MASIPFADNFLAGSLLTLLMPVLLLIALVVWYMIAIRKVPETPESSPSLPSPEVVAATSQPTTQPGSPPAAQPSPDSPRTEPPTTGA